MYNVSEAYKTAIVNRTRDCYITGTITLSDNTVIEVPDKDIKSLYIVNQCVPDGGVDVGFSAVGEQGITISDSTSNYRIFKDAAIQLTYYLKTNIDAYEGVPLGVFKVIDAQRATANTIKLVGYDNMTKFDVDYPLNAIEKSAMRTPFARLKDVCAACGAGLWDTDLEVEYTIGNMPNGTLSHNLAFSPEIITARDYIDWVCQLLCAFATIDRNGNLKIVCWKLIGLSTAYSIPASLRKSTIIGDIKVGYNQLNMQVTFAQDAAVKIITAPETPLSTGDTLKAPTNPLIRAGLYSNAQAILDAAAAALTNTDPEYSAAIMRWYPCVVQYTGDPALDLGDWVTYVGYTAGDGITAPIHKIDWTYRGFQTLTTVDITKNNTAVNSQRSAANSAAQSQTTVVDNLSSTSTTAALSANQGRVIDINKSDKSTIHSYTLNYDSWQGSAAPYAYTLIVEEAAADNIIEIAPSISELTTTADIDVLLASKIIGGAQAAGSIILYAYGTKPTMDLPVIVIVRGDT